MTAKRQVSKAGVMPTLHVSFASEDKCCVECARGPSPVDDSACDDSLRREIHDSRRPSSFQLSWTINSHFPF